MKRTDRSQKLVLFFCLYSIFTTAQIIPDATPDNITETVDLIFELHGGNIDNDYATVYDFIDNLLPSSSSSPDYDLLCPPPNAVVDNANSTIISCSWTAIPSAYSYQASFLKLNQFPSTGPESGSIVTTNTDVQFPISNGLVLMAFQTYCSPSQKGRLFIIIVDKPVFLDRMLNGCHCDFPGEPDIKSFGYDGSTSITMPYTHSEGSTGYYQGSIYYVGEAENSNFLISAALDEDMIAIGKQESCMININNYTGGNILYSIYAEPDGEVLGSLAFSNPAGMVFNPVPGAIGTFTLIECFPNAFPKSKFTAPKDNDSSTSAKLETTLNAVPNPAKNTVSIIVPSDLKIEDCNYFMIDAIGNQTAFSSGLHHFNNGALEIQIDHLPVGVYCFIIQNKDKVMKTRFVKIN